MSALECRSDTCPYAGYRIKARSLPKAALLGGDSRFGPCIRLLEDMLIEPAKDGEGDECRLPSRVKSIEECLAGYLSVRQVKLASYQSSCFVRQVSVVCKNGQESELNKWNKTTRVHMHVEWSLCHT
jgi:hypothetical protein